MKNNYVIMGTMLPCNRLADTFDVDVPSCIACSSCGNELSKTLSEKIRQVPPRLYRQEEYDVCIYEIKTKF